MGRQHCAAPIGTDTATAAVERKAYANAGFTLMMAVDEEMREEVDALAADVASAQHVQNDRRGQSKRRGCENHWGL